MFNLKSAVKVSLTETSQHRPGQKGFRVRSKLILLLALIGVVFSLNVYGQTTNLLDSKVTIDAVDASLSNVLTTMARLSESNIVLAVGVIDKEKDDEPKITVSLKDIPIEQALSLVVKAVGLSYRLIGDNTFLVGPRDRIQEEVGERTYVVHLNYVEADKVVRALSIMQGEAQEIQGQNAILLKANPVTFAEISKRIKEIDVPQKQVEIRARLIEVSISESKRLGIDWSKLNRLTTILAENPVNADGVGLPFEYTDVTGALTHGSSTPLGELPASQYFQKMDDWGNVGRFSRQLTAFDVTINWLLENSAAKLLTDTRITALNGENAEIHIGEVVPFVVTDREYRSQVEREEVGIMLKVRPSVNKDGLITITINPEVSSVIELVAGFVPRTKVRRVISTVTVPDGSKIILGGLLSTNIINSVNKVPLLGDLPWIGKLFRHFQEELSTTDLIIEITPRIVNLEDHQVEFEFDERLERRIIKVVDDESNEYNAY